MSKTYGMIAVVALGALLSAGAAWAGTTTTTVPEPTSLALLATAIGGVAIAKIGRAHV